MDGKTQCCQLVNTALSYRINATSTGFVVELYWLVKNVYDNTKDSMLAKTLLEKEGRQEDCLTHCHKDYKILVERKTLWHWPRDRPTEQGGEQRGQDQTCRGWPWILEGQQF